MLSLSIKFALFFLLILEDDKQKANILKTNLSKIDSLRVESCVLFATHFFTHFGSQLWVKISPKKVWYWILNGLKFCTYRDFTFFIERKYRKTVYWKESKNLSDWIINHTFFSLLKSFLKISLFDTFVKVWRLKIWRKFINLKATRSLHVEKFTYFWEIVKKSGPLKVS